MSTLLTWVLAASALLAPDRSHDRLAPAIAKRVEAEPPLFRDDADRRKTTALLVAVAFRESSLRPDVVGDHVNGKPTSFCAYQINLPWGRKTPEGWSGEELAADPDKCVAAAFRMLKESFRVCPKHPIAWYAEGPGGCKSNRAQRISRDRVALAQHLLRKVPFEAEGEEGATSSRAPSAPADARPGPSLALVANCPAAPRPRRTWAPGAALAAQRFASCQFPSSEPALLPL